MSGALLRRARVRRFTVAELVGPRLVPDRATEVLERDKVALAGQEQASAAVVPHGAHLLAAVSGLDLG
jgi:hypothetical protein